MRIVQTADCLLLCAARLGACEAVTPKNPVKAVQACGYAEDQVGGRIVDLDLKLVTSDWTTVSEVHTDAGGNFQFPTVRAGTSFIISGSRGWTLNGWPIQITSAEVYVDCKHPLIVRPSLDGCGGSIS